MRLATTALEWRLWCRREQRLCCLPSEVWNVKCDGRASDEVARWIHSVWPINMETGVSGTRSPFRCARPRATAAPRIRIRDPVKASPAPRSLARCEGVSRVRPSRPARVKERFLPTRDAKHCRQQIKRETAGLLGGIAVEPLPIRSTELDTGMLRKVSRAQTTALRRRRGMSADDGASSR